MVQVNGYKYAETEGEFIDSLFDGKYTCYGYAKRFKRKIMFYNKDYKAIACINKYGCLCGVNEFKDEGTGKKGYLYYYCLPDVMKQKDGSILFGANIADDLCTRKEYNKELEYWYK